MSEQDRIRALAVPLIQAARNKGPQAVADLRPRADDFAKVFTGDAIALATTHFERLWEQNPEITAKSDQTDLAVYAVTTELIESSQVFPGGYKQLVPHLVAGTIWIAWKFTRPGESSGMSYDGLVHVGDRFIWLPKPWRMLAKAQDPFYVD